MIKKNVSDLLIVIYCTILRSCVKVQCPVKVLNGGVKVVKAIHKVTLLVIIISIVILLVNVLFSFLIGTCNIQIEKSDSHRNYKNILYYVSGDLVFPWI